MKDYLWSVFTALVWRTQRREWLRVGSASNYLPAEWTCLLRDCCCCRSAGQSLLGNVQRSGVVLTSGRGEERIREHKTERARLQDTGRCAGTSYKKPSDPCLGEEVSKPANTSVLLMFGCVITVHLYSSHQFAHTNKA